MPIRPGFRQESGPIILPCGVVDKIVKFRV